MHEIICNIHIHSTYSDGHGRYSAILAAAAQANLDVVIVTDHNVWVKGLEGYYESNGRQVLVLTGEEVHDQGRDPQKNHMLVLGAEGEVATHASDPQELIDTVHQKGGLAFLAHPDEVALPLVHEDDISWVNWNVHGYTGFELWNQFSELKTVSQSTLALLGNVFFPEGMTTCPSQATLQRWDQLLAAGQHLSVIGGADAHAIPYHVAGFTKIIFPYRFHFSSLNNHLMLEEPLSADIVQAKKQIYAALGQGSSFIGYDLPASTRGFSFAISGDEMTANMGDTLPLTRGATVQVSLPSPAELRLIKDGTVIYRSQGNDHLAYPLAQPGVYRIECYREFQNKKRGWIFSNPIYVTKND